MRDRFVPPVSTGCGAFRPAVTRVQCNSTSNNVSPQFLETEHTRGLWPSLDSAFGAGFFNDGNAATRWGVFYGPGSRHAQAL